MKRDFALPSSSDADDDGKTASVGRPRVVTLHKMKELLAAFTPERPSWKLQELETHLGWDKATAHRFLYALAEIAMLERGADGNYRIGVFPLELAAVQSNANPPRRELTRQVDAIASHTGLTTQLSIQDGGEMVIIGSSEGAGPLNAAAMLGQRIPLHVSAAGKAILSQLDDEEIAALLPEELPSLASQTIRTRADLMVEVEAIRRGSLARANSELAEGLIALAVPIPAGLVAAVPAAIACAGPPPALAWKEWSVAERELERLAKTLSTGHGRHVTERRQAQ